MLVSVDVALGNTKTLCRGLGLYWLFVLGVVLRECGVVERDLLRRLGDRSLTTDVLYKSVERDFGLLPRLLEGVFSSKASVRYGCAKVLSDLSVAYPERLYPHMDFFVSLLDSKYRILVWNALAITANLAKVDVDKRFDRAFNAYFGLLDSGYMVTVANVVGNSGKIALAKPYLIDRITDKLLKVEDISVTPHLTEECKRVIAEKTIKSFDLFFDRVREKKRVIAFVEKHSDGSRKTLRVTAQSFLKKWNAD
jgi:hypothetical protein